MVNNRLIRHLLIQCAKGQANSWRKEKHLSHQWQVIFKSVNHLEQMLPTESTSTFLFMPTGLTNWPGVGEQGKNGSIQDKMDMKCKA